MPRDPDETPSEGTSVEDLTPTQVQCAACGGDFQKLFETERGHRMSTCPWCTRGSMTAKQLARWHARRQGRNR